MCVCVCVCVCVSGCPLILTDLAVVDKLETLTKAERELMCSLLFTAINWFREVRKRWSVC